MVCPKDRSRNFAIQTRAIGTIRSLTIVLALMSLTMPAAQAQTFTVLHTFTGGADGAAPMAGLSLDRAGNLYGTASGGGSGYGSVYRLAHRGSGWTLNPLYNFQGGTDGATPVAAVVFGPDGSLYGTTEYGGTPGHCYYTTGCGTVFNLKPPPTRPNSVFSPWIETVLHRFDLGYGDGVTPLGEVAFDAAGNLFGTASISGGGCDGVDCGGCQFCGIVYQMTPSGGSWSYDVFYRFLDWDNGASPESGLLIDQTGNLYGTNSTGGDCGFGMIFGLTPLEQNLHTFCGYQNDGADPSGGLIMDSAGNIYGGTPGALPGYGTQQGSVYMLAPSNGGWIFSVLYNFADGNGPAATLTMDAAGTLYGTTFYGGNISASCSPYGCGTIFKLTPSSNGWIYTTLYKFNGSDGQNPDSRVLIDANGNLFGTASAGGPFTYGVVWEITP